jgi:hypothetical protein
MAQQKLIGDAQHYGREQIDLGRQRGHELISKYVPPEAQPYAREQLEGKMGKKVVNEMLGGSFRGYGIRDDMGTLLNGYHPATTPYLQPPNIPQGQISGGSFGGSMCGCGTPILDQKFSINDVKHFATHDLKKLFGGRVRGSAIRASLGRSNQSSEGGSFYGGSFQ